LERHLRAGGCVTASICRSRPRTIDAVGADHVHFRPAVRLMPSRVSWVISSRHVGTSDVVDNRPGAAGISRSGLQSQTRGYPVLSAPRRVVINQNLIREWLRCGGFRTHHSISRFPIDRGQPRNYRQHGTELMISARIPQVTAATQGNGRLPLDRRELLPRCQCGSSRTFLRGGRRQR